MYGGVDLSEGKSAACAAPQIAPNARNAHSRVVISFSPRAVGFEQSQSDLTALKAHLAVDISRGLGWTEAVRLHFVSESRCCSF
jgi:hypothetical protein